MNLQEPRIFFFFAHNYSKPFAHFCHRFYNKTNTYSALKSIYKYTKTVKISKGFLLANTATTGVKKKAKLSEENLLI
ncbi:hypothetical protein D1815_13315 [Aquimarina sp. AD1]|nr:hypothetical protein D1815_13315 [Aquimarina sp. AD1]RKN06385.1 hypothetical protein D7035_20995 [Aquimarina sp. AD1]